VPLPDQIDIRMARVTADGAYDGAPTYDTIAVHGDDIEAVILPRSTAVLCGEQGPIAQHDRHLEMITEQGQSAWAATAFTYHGHLRRHDLGLKRHG
jgi:hypothetical protein